MWTRYRWISSASNSRVARCTFASCSLTSSRKQDSVYANGNQQSAEMKATIDKSFPFCILWKCKCFAESIFSYYYSLEALSFYFHGENSLRSNTESDLKYINLFIQIMKFIKISNYFSIYWYFILQCDKYSDQRASIWISKKKKDGKTTLQTFKGEKNLRVKIEKVKENKFWILRERIDREKIGQRVQKVYRQRFPFRNDDHWTDCSLLLCSSMTAAQSTTWCWITCVYAT